MRRILLLAVAGSLALAGAAYAATTVTPKYILHVTVRPKAGGSPAHPVPIGSTFAYTVRTSPPNQRPPVVSHYHIYWYGLQQNVRYFPVCSTSTLNSRGPSGCRSGSQVGSGYFMAAIGPSSTTSVSLTCRADIRVYNDGGRSLIFYVYRGAEANACPLTSTYTILVHLTPAHGGRDLAIDFAAPQALRHPAAGFDAAVVSSSITIQRRVRRVKVHGVSRMIGLFASDYCPPNHERTILASFRAEDGHTRTASTHVACS